MHKKICVSALICTILAISVQADTFYDTAPSETRFGTGIYIGAAYGYTKVDDDYFEYYPNSGLSVHTEIDYDAIMLQAGFQYNPYIAFEFRYWTALSDGDYSISSNYPPLYPPAPGSYDDFDAWGFYIKPMYPVTTEFSVYGLLGFSGVYVAGEPGWDLLDDSDFSWGLGASYNVTPNISIFADYVWLFEGTVDRYGYDFDSSQDTKVDTFNFGVSYRF